MKFPTFRERVVMAIVRSSDTKRKKWIREQNGTNEILFLLAFKVAAVTNIYEYPNGNGINIKRWAYKMELLQMNIQMV